MSKYESNKYSDIKSLIEKANLITQIEIKESINLVNQIINSKNRNEEFISRVFDKMLSMGFVSEEEIKDIYFRLISYTKSFNSELSKDYERIFIEQFKDISKNKILK